MPRDKDWVCPDHMWHGDLIYASRTVECDWCIVCSAVRPGFIDPQEKWDKDAQHNQA